MYQQEIGSLRFNRLSKRVLMLALIRTCTYLFFLSRFVSLLSFFFLTNFSLFFACFVLYRCSYNAINGIPACANYELLTQIAREKWNFKGYNNHSGIITKQTQNKITQHSTTKNKITQHNTTKTRKRNTTQQHNTIQHEDIYYCLGMLWETVAR